MSKKGHQFFSGNIGVTPSVATLGDTNPSDATVPASFKWYTIPHHLLRLTKSVNGFKHFLDGYVLSQFLC